MKTIKIMMILCLLSTVVPSIALSDKEAAAMLVSMDKCLEGNCKHEPNEHTESRYDKEVKLMLVAPDLTHRDLRVIERKCSTSTRHVYLDLLKSGNSSYQGEYSQCFKTAIWERQKFISDVNRASAEREAANLARENERVQKKGNA